MCMLYSSPPSLPCWRQVVPVYAYLAPSLLRPTSNAPFTSSGARMYYWWDGIAHLFYGFIDVILLNRSFGNTLHINTFLLYKMPVHIYFNIIWFSSCKLYLHLLQNYPRGRSQVTAKCLGYVHAFFICSY